MTVEPTWDALVERVRAASHAGEVAIAILDALLVLPEVRGVAVELELPRGRVVWVQGPGLDADLVRNTRADCQLADASSRSSRSSVLPAALDGCQAQAHGCTGAGCTLWLVPLLGEDGVAGAVRIAVANADDWFASCAVLAMHVSVRLAQLGELVCPGSRRPLTPRQHQVAVLVARGFTNGEIAGMLAISANAVKKHLSRAFEALDVTSRAELAAHAARWPFDPAAYSRT
jgi:DNA-binding CsgD family transcriptional regulator